MSEREKIEDVADVKCPQCKAIISVKRRVVYNQPDPRRKIEEEYFAEKSIQKTLDEEEAEE